VQSFNDVWDIVKDLIKDSKKISNVAFDTWIGCIKPQKLSNNTVILIVPSEFQKNIVIEKYSSLIEDYFKEILGFDINITFIVEDESFNSKNLNGNIENGKNDNESSINYSKSKGDYEYTFDTFIVGSSNKFAHAACLAVASNPSDSYNPLFIYGPSGLGKTHLLYAISNEIGNEFKNKKILYVKGDEFTNELIEAIKTKKTIEFHNKYRIADVLLVDDIQFISGKESTQEEFFHTFNHLYQDKKQIVLTSDRPPKEIKTLEDRLRTRFEWGLLADIITPDFETRMAIIKRKAQLLGLNIKNDVAEYIANHIKNNIRQLEGTVKKLEARFILENLEPTLHIAEDAIKDILNSNVPISITIDKVFEEIERTFNITAKDLKSTKQSSNISKARQITIYILQSITDMTLTDIGEELGGRDHSTMVYAKKTIEAKMDKDQSLKELIEDIIKNLMNN